LLYHFEKTEYYGEKAKLHAQYGLFCEQLDTRLCSETIQKPINCIYLIFHLFVFISNSRTNLVPMYLYQCVIGSVLNPDILATSDPDLGNAGCRIRVKVTRIRNTGYWYWLLFPIAAQCLLSKQNLRLQITNQLMSPRSQKLFNEYRK